MISLTQEGNTLRVHFKYNLEYVNLIKTVNGARYDGGGWIVPLTALDRLLELFPVYRVDSDRIEALEASWESERGKREEYLRSLKPVYAYDFVTAPRPHQIEGFNFLLQKRRVILGDEMGTGKTKQVLDTFGALRDHLDGPFLVIVGVNSLKYNWVETEIPKHSRLRGVAIEGTKAKRLRLLEEVRAGKYDIAVINAESLRTGDLLNALAATPWEAIAIDESHKAGLKNPRSQVGAAVHKLKAEWQIAMTGTPLMNRPDELYNMLKWVGAEKRSWWAFLRDLCIYGGFDNREVVGYRAEAVRELRSKLERVMLRRLKKDALDLPPKESRAEWIDMDKEQKALYERVKKQTLEELDSPNLMAVNALTKTLRLRQVLSSPEIHAPGMEGAKIKRLLELLEEITENGQKALVFSNWTEVTSRLLPKLAQYNTAYITGEVPDKKQAQEVKRFQETSDCKVALGTIGAMGTGWTLTAASWVIFVDWDWTPGNNEQAEDRAHRDGTKWPVNVLYLAARDTIDQHLLDMLASKKDVFDMLVNGRLMGAQAKALVKSLLEA